MSAAEATPKSSSKRARSSKGHKLEPLSFSRCLKAAFDDPANRKLSHMTRVAASGNKRCAQFMQSLMDKVLAPSQALLCHGKKVGLEKSNILDAFRLMLPHDQLNLINRANAYAEARIAQYTASFEAAPEDEEEEKKDDEEEEEEEPAQKKQKKAEEAKPASKKKKPTSDDDDDE